MGQNKLQMNPSKTEFISFSSKTMIKRITRTNITVCNDTVSCSPCIKLLGSYLDQSLTMSIHITKKCSLAMWNLSQIWSIKNCLDTDSLKTTVQALCISHLDYNNTLFYGLPTKDINHLQCLQNSCAKLVLGKTDVTAPRHAWNSFTGYLLNFGLGLKFYVLCIEWTTILPLSISIRWLRRRSFIDKPEVPLPLDHCMRYHSLRGKHFKLELFLSQDQLSGTIFQST